MKQTQIYAGVTKISKVKETEPIIFKVDFLYATVTSCFYVSHGTDFQ